MTEHELDTLLRDYGGAVRSVCRAILPGHPQDAEEAEADTFYKLWRGAHLPADEAHRRRLVVQAARQCAIDRYRALLRRGETLPLDDRDDAELAVALESELETRELMAQIMALPPPDGELFLRRYVYGETAAQLGVHFNMPAATVRTRLHRARLALRQKVLARRPKPRVLRGWRLAAAAAALCLVAAGAVVLGLFHPMSAANEANALVQKYGEVLDEPLTTEINGHTVSVKALLRDKNTLRVLYDVDNAKGMEPNDLVWDTGAFYLRAADNSGDKRLYIASNAQVGPCYGYAIGSWATRNTVSEGDVLSCYVDIPLTQTATDTRTLYICDLTNHKASAHVKVMLPDMAEAVTLNVKKTIALKGGHWFHYDMTDEEAEQYPDATFDIQEVRIEPLAVSVIGMNHGSLPLGGTSRYDVQSRVKLFRADGTELTYGWDGEFYQGFYGRVSKYSGQSALRVNTYNLIDPEAVAWVEIDGERFEVE